MAVTIARLAAVLALAFATPAVAALSPDELARAGAHPSAHVALPASLRFATATGGTATLDAVAAGHPLVLIFADYTCTHICAPGLMMSAAALKGTGLAPGDDYRVAVIGLDPKDSAADARTMAAKMTVDPAITRATTFLIGDARVTNAAAKALGYGYVYDPDGDQFAHDASVYVFAPDGRLSAMLPELGLIPTTLRAALDGASVPPPSFAAQVAHLCYGFAAAHGRYGRAIVIAMQALSALLLVGLGAFLLKRRQPA